MVVQNETSPITTSKPRQRATSTRHAVAYHEAGHAVVGVLLRWAIKEVSIIPTLDTLGRVIHPRSFVDYWAAEEIASHRRRSGIDLRSLVEPPDRPGQSRLRRARARIDIAVRLAGRKAEKRFTGKWNNNVGGFDRFQVLDLAVQLSRELRVTPDRIILEESRRASQLLDANWSCVEAVAAALLEGNRLSGREVRAIVNGTKQRSIRSSR